MSEPRFTVGGSEAAAACGIHPFESQVMLWARKTGRIPPPPETEGMLWGKLLEPVIIDVLGNHGYLVSSDEMPEYSDPDRPWMVGHPDAFAYDADQDRHYVVDVKTTGPWNAAAWDDGAPIQYVTQLLHYMHLTGLDHGLLACLIGGQKLELRTIDRDQATIDLMLAGEEAFVRYCVRDEPPPPAGASSDGDALREMFPGEAGKSVRLDRAGMALVAEFRERSRQFHAVKRQCDELKQAIQLLMGDAEVALTLSDEVAAKWTSYLRQGQPARRFTA